MPVGLPPPLDVVARPTRTVWRCAPTLLLSSAPGLRARPPPNVHIPLYQFLLLTTRSIESVLDDLGHVLESKAQTIRHLSAVFEAHCLTADEDRERKAETRRPGTFGLVLTPTAFLRSEIPEYASSADGRLQQSNIRAPRPRYGRQSNRLAPNVVILDRFEDASPVSASWPPGTDRRRSDPELASLSIKTEALSTGYSTAPGTPLARSDEHLIRHFRQYIVPRLVQPQHPGTLLPSSIPDVLEYEAARFRPLHHSICAISARPTIPRSRSC